MRTCRRRSPATLRPSRDSDKPIREARRGSRRISISGCNVSLAGTAWPWPVLASTSLWGPRSYYPKVAAGAQFTYGQIVRQSLDLSVVTEDEDSE